MSTKFVVQHNRGPESSSYDPNPNKYYNSKNNQGDKMEEQHKEAMPQFFREALERLGVDPSTLLTILVRGSRVRDSHSETSDWDVCAVTTTQSRFTFLAFLLRSLFFLLFSLLSLRFSNDNHQSTDRKII